MRTTLEGIGAAPGRAEGRVRWILSADDMKNFEVGEVLLAKMTSPDWGEVFQKAAAVVTEQGGMLCHAAIVAREEGIPAVVGVGEGLSQFPNGMVVIADGDEGYISPLLRGPVGGGVADACRPDGQSQADAPTAAPDGSGQ